MMGRFIIVSYSSNALFATGATVDRGTYPLMESTSMTAGETSYLKKGPSMQDLGLGFGTILAGQLITDAWLRYLLDTNTLSLILGDSVVMENMSLCVRPHCSFLAVLLVELICCANISFERSCQSRA